MYADRTFTLDLDLHPRRVVELLDELLDVHEYDLPSLAEMRERYAGHDLLERITVHENFKALHDAFRASSFFLHVYVPAHLLLLEVLLVTGINATGDLVAEERTWAP